MDKAAEITRLKARLAYLTWRIIDAEHWGALLTALSEERNAVLRNLDDLRKQ